MNSQRIAGIPHELTSLPTRRHVLHGLAGLGLTLAASWRPEDADAKKKNKKKKGKKKQQPNVPPTSPPPPTPPTPNAYGCFSVGVTCTSASECCSSLCDGGVCQGHGAGTCSPQLEAVCEAGTPSAALYCNNSTKCYCTRTTGGSNFCGSIEVYGCADCSRDADCLDLGFPAGTACAPFSTGICASTCQSGRICMTPCGTLRGAIAAREAAYA